MFSRCYGEKMKVLFIKNFETPYTNLPDLIYGKARITHVIYEDGLYRMEGVYGYSYYELLKPIKVTLLQVKTRVNRKRKWKTWMVDDPLHWYGMKEFSERCRNGNVLVAGLGLGLIVHHLAKRKDITEIIVVEKNRDVIGLIKPCLSFDKRIKIIHGNYYKWIEKFAEKRKHFDNIIVDLWVGKGIECQSEYDWARTITEMLYPYPKTLSLYWGFQKIVDLQRDAQKIFKKHIKILKERGRT